MCSTNRFERERVPLDADGWMPRRLRRSGITASCERQRQRVESEYSSPGAAAEGESESPHRGDRAQMHAVAATKAIALWH